MIRTLQKKFVVTSMTAIGILLLVLTASLNVIYAYSSYKQNERILDMLSEKEFSVLWQIPSEFGSVDYSGFLRPPINESTRRSSIYFIAYADNKGDIIFIDTTASPEITKEQALSISQQAAKSDKDGGTIDAYRYKTVRTQSNIGTAYVFLNITAERTGIVFMLFLSFAVNAVCFAFMLLIVAALSKKAIRPIAENMEKQKTFVTDAGHEIKTPLAIIMANTQALELHTSENKWTKNIKEQTERLSTLMQELLTLSRLEELKTDNMFETVCVSETAQNTVSMFYESAALKGVIINESIEPDIFMKADREHITRLISVLTDNAVKYSTENSQIDLSLSKKDKKICLTVRNVCASLPDCKSEKLFDRFYRGDSSRNQSGGYGIGLSAAKAITELYKGKISAEYKSGNVIEFKVII